MTSWRSEILKRLMPGIARLTIVADPDRLLLEPTLSAELAATGYLLLVYDDPIEFRHQYEGEVRYRWDEGEALEVLVVVVAESSEIGSLPFDLLQGSRQLSIGLPELFPNLDYRAVSALDRADLDSLWSAQESCELKRLSKTATLDFALRHVFGIAPEVAKQPSDLLQLLLKKHYTGRPIPFALDQYLLQSLRRNPQFAQWPLEELIPNSDAFLLFLQERWPHFLNRLAAKQVTLLHDKPEPFGMRIDGPIDIPFDHKDVRVYVDNLFVEGQLQSVQVRDGEALKEAWLQSGIQTDPIGDRWRRFQRLVERTEHSIPSQTTRYLEWLDFAHRWAELRVLSVDLVADGPHSQADAALGTLERAVDASFTQWLTQRYAGLYNQPPVPPVMVHHIPRAIARYREEYGAHRVALLVVDGLALDQWHLVRRCLADDLSDLHIRESALFAWIPTLTSVSRQAIFAGKPPHYFPNSIYITSKEPELWTRFWGEQGVGKSSVAYRKGLGEGDMLEVEQLVFDPNLQVLGLVIDTVDKIMHGMQLGLVGLHNQVSLWVKGGYLHNLIRLLIGSKFTVWLVADHGNVEAIGTGRLAEGAEADLPGARARIYPSALLRSGAAGKAPGTVEWESPGLPSDCYPLLAQGRSAFHTVSKRRVTHGGSTLEEVIVPWIQIEAE